MAIFAFLLKAAFIMVQELFIINKIVTIIIKTKPLAFVKVDLDQCFHQRPVYIIRVFSCLGFVPLWQQQTSFSFSSSFWQELHIKPNFALAITIAINIVANSDRHLHFHIHFIVSFIVAVIA